MGLDVSSRHIYDLTVSPWLGPQPADVVEDRCIGDPVGRTN